MMLGLERWEWLLLAGSAVVAVSALVQLMLARRDELLRKLRADFEVEQERKREEERRAKRAEKKKVPGRRAA